MITVRWIAAMSVAVTLLAGLTGRALGQDLLFESAGVPIRVERFEAAGAGMEPAPAVLLLHGSDGAGERYRLAARLIASAGYHVFLVHYLDRTGERRAVYRNIARDMPLWIETAAEAVSFAAAQPDVDAERLGLLGISLGGGIAAAVAGGEPRVRVLVSFLGFLPEGAERGRMPATLVLHGAEDRVVPVAHARAIEAVLRAQGAPHEVAIYPGEGHRFTSAAQTDAGMRILRFLRRHL